MSIILLSSVPYNKTRGNSVYANSIANEINKKVFLIQPTFKNNSIKKINKYLTIINIKVSNKFNQKNKLFYTNVEKTINKIKKKFGVSLIHILYGHYFKKFIKRLDSKLVWTCHNVPPNEYTFQGYKNIFIIKILLKLIIFLYHLLLIYLANYKLIIVNSNRVKKIFKYLQFLFPKILVIGCGHNFKKPPSPIKENKKNKINILTISSFKPHKKIEVVIELAKRLEKREINYSWIVLADKYNTHYEKKIINIKKNCNIKNVKFISKITEQKKNDLYKKSDIYIQTSNEEGFCIPFLEASCHNHLLVLGTPTGAIPEISKSFGCYVCKNTDDFFNKIKLRINKGIGIRKISNKIINQWSWKMVAKKTIDAYKKT
ncbi:glycosyltransferase [Candidatus Pelagibacter ubique]|nr:glycosyltransferase [Candidatus Pelagibacter ubique]